jgi:SSS family solute:Na+ symporter
MNFTFIDAIIIALYLCLTIFVGLKAKKYIESSESYFVAGRKVKLALGVATLIATEIGTVTFMYVAEFGFTMGFSAFIVGILGMIGFLIIGYSGFIVTGLRKLKIMTIPEFYEIKYNKNVRVLGGIILFMSGILNMGIFLKFDALFLSETMGFGPDALLFIMIVILVIVISYTILGGMLSVVITDFLQFVILSISMLVVTIIILSQISFFDISKVVVENYGAGGVNPFKNFKMGWFFIGWTVIANFTMGSLNQPVAAKAFCADSPKTARKVFLFYGVTLAGRQMIPMIWGLAALAYFGPSISATIAMPRLIATLVPTGMLGVIIAGMVAASMSTYSAYLLSWSSVATRDIVTPLKKKPVSEESSMKMAKIFSLFIGIFILIFGFIYEIPATAMQYIILTGTMYSSGAFAVIAGGLYWKRANNKGAFSALCAGALMPILFLVLEKFKSSLPVWLHFLTDINISGFVGMILPVLVMVIVSLLTQKSSPPKDIISNLKEA